MTTPSRTASPRLHPPGLALLAAVAALAAAAPAAACAGDTFGLTLQAWGAKSRYDVGGLRQGIANQGSDLLQDKASTFGATAVLRLGNLDVGALYEGRLIRQRTDSAVVTPVLGLAIPLGSALRLDLLGELGGHRISNVQVTGSVDLAQARTVWLPYLGVRPTLTLLIPIGGPRVALSIAPFARWDLVKKTVTLTSSGTTASTSAYDVGGTTFGVAALAGLEL